MFRLAIVAVICAVAFASPAERQRRQAANNCLDAFSNVPNPCTNNPSNQVYFPHPSDNSKFIQCDRYGRMYIIQCPQNLLYSSATSTCRQVATTAAPSALTNAPVVVNPPTNTGANPCTPQALAAGQIYFAVNGDNTKFIECDMLGHANVLPCPSGLVWEESRLSCVYKFSVAGGNVGGVVTQQPSGPGTVTGTGGTGGSGNTGGNPCTAANIQAKDLFHAHPDPTKFYQCDLWGDVYVVSCPAGLIWNQFSETCASAFVTVNGGK